MPASRLIVLKFGGSVLKREVDLACAVHETYRWRRDGWKVVAIVSALQGRTDELLQDCASFIDDASRCAVATHVACGEIDCASLLGLYLDRAGVPAMVLHPAAAQLRASGTPLDAEATSIDRDVVRRALDAAGVVVLPGYMAIDEYGRTVVLGRGGSDLSALFVAHCLGADRCRLIKDVNGLYEFDPRLIGAPPRRYEHATWDEALATDGSIVQHKAVMFARDAQFPFELGTYNAHHVTRIGSPATAFATISAGQRLRVAMLGLGTVGTGVWQHLQRMGRNRIEVTAIAVQHVNRRRTPAAPRSILTDDAMLAATSGADVVVELIGGTTVARECVEAAIDCGSHVVTANKALMAEHGVRLRKEAADRGVQLLCAAAVGGSMPLYEFMSSPTDPVIQVRAVLNGACNFVLDRVGNGVPFEAAVAEARELGYCELDCNRDLDGIDAADKLCLLAHVAGFEHLTPQHIDREAITLAHVMRAQTLVHDGSRLCQVATLEQIGGAVHGTVALTEIHSGDPLFHVSGVWNKAVIRWASGACETISGRGAGRWPTAEAVVADILTLERSLLNSHAPGEVLYQNDLLNSC